MILHIFILILIMLWIGSIGPLLGSALDYGFESLEDIFDPGVRYETGGFNIFGTILITVALNLFMLPMSIIFWIYKLCTIGRR